MSTDPTGADSVDGVVRMVRVVRGSATAEELAAVVAALRVRAAARNATARKPATGAAGRPSRWVASGRPGRPPGWAGARLP